MKKISFYCILLVLLPFVSANVVISQILSDPINTESGGEAVELRNDGDDVIDISGWVLSTESSAKDAVIPDGKFIQPGDTFLIADSGWFEKKDNVDWRLADHEESITLGNSKGGVALIKNDEVIDAVGWGDEEDIKEGLFSGTPADSPDAGMALVRIKNTGDNKEDFSVSQPDFMDGIPIAVSADVTVVLPKIEVSKSLKLDPEGVLTVKNNGDSAVSIKLVFNDLHYKNFNISKERISIEGSSEFVVQPFSSHELKIRLRIPADVVPGNYMSTWRIITSYS